MVFTVQMNYNFLNQFSINTYLSNFQFYAIQKTMNVETHTRCVVWMSASARQIQEYTILFLIDITKLLCI